jgi:cytochrome c oxidase subunit II
VGPDLTHLASRRTLAAGTMPNNAGTLAGWIEGAQELKPGNQMPDQNLPAAQVADLVAYLETLR